MSQATPQLYLGSDLLVYESVAALIQREAADISYNNEAKWFSVEQRRKLLDSLSGAQEHLEPGKLEWATAQRTLQPGRVLAQAQKMRSATASEMLDVINNQVAYSMGAHLDQALAHYITGITGITKFTLAKPRPGLVIKGAL